jgi:hypothetical protein
MIKNCKPTAIAKMKAVKVSIPSKKPKGKK